jgi:hypothetical protein
MMLTPPTSRASHASEALEGVYLGSSPAPGAPPALLFPPTASQLRHANNVAAFSSPSYY